MAQTIAQFMTFKNNTSAPVAVHEVWTNGHEVPFTLAPGMTRVSGSSKDGPTVRCIGLSGTFSGSPHKACIDPYGDFHVIIDGRGVTISKA